MSYPLHYRVAQSKWVQSDILKIISVSALVFVLVHFVRIAALISGKPAVFFDTYLWPHLSLPPTWQDWVQKPWTLITYPFMDLSFMQLFVNMIWLWVFGRALEDLHGNYRVLPIFFMGSLLGGIAWMSLNTFMPGTTALPLAGAFPGVLAVGMAMVLYNPRYPVWVLFSMSIPFWALFGVFVLLNVLTLQHVNVAYWGMSLAALLGGVLYNYGPLKYYDFLHRAFSKTGFFTNNDNFVLKPKNTRREQLGKVVPFRTIDVDMQRIDLILDKINEKGIESLTEHEKSILEKYSQKP